MVPSGPGRVRIRGRIRNLLFLLATIALVTACGSSDGAGQTADPASTTVEVTTTSSVATSTTTTTAQVPTTTVAAEEGHSHFDDGEGRRGGETLTVTGVVVAVEGNLSATESITLRLKAGTNLIMVPSEDATFHHGPFSHIRDHLASSEPVTVEYIVLDDGTLRALSASDR